MTTTHNTLSSTAKMNEDSGQISETRQTSSDELARKSNIYKLTDAAEMQFENYDEKEEPQLHSQADAKCPWSDMPTTYGYNMDGFSPEIEWYSDYYTCHTHGDYKSLVTSDDNSSSEFAQPKESQHDLQEPKEKVAATTDSNMEFFPEIPFFDLADFNPFIPPPPFPMTGLSVSQLPTLISQLAPRAPAKERKSTTKTTPQKPRKKRPKADPNSYNRVIKCTWCVDLNLPCDKTRHKCPFCDIHSIECIRRHCKKWNAPAKRCKKGGCERVHSEDTEVPHSRSGNVKVRK
ncbi:hypothetical protein GMOD_00000522 [Pyrenophora seminiperda CCB06]|uniref:Uncharacterized protein n=1 Tax=Pyrenophora seminiperda CCB06 TaxID=1302712 RepID=A0A3M7M7G2_9PLEO|nr:hypothetical protein GMOD_00000522 [Pyrenophora seminiperda CCB06]